MAQRSELEGVVLGVVHRKQPCTAYAVRRELSASPSTYWSGSAGSIYPLLSRLESGGLVSSDADPGDGRKRRLLRLTPDGLTALRSWTTSGPRPETVAAVSDPVRTRVFFLSALNAAERRRFATECMVALTRYLDETRRQLAQRSDQPGNWDYLADLGAVYEAEARVAWMQVLLEYIERTPND